MFAVFQVQVPLSKLMFRLLDFSPGCYHCSERWTSYYADLRVTTMDEQTRRVLNLFAQMKSDTLDLHTLFEAGGNDPDARGQVLDVVARLVRDGLLEERGSDFYKLTTKGRSAIGNR